MCFTRASNIEQSASRDAQSVDTPLPVGGDASTSPATVDDPKLQEQYDAWANLAEEAADLFEQWELYIVNIGLQKCIEALGGIPRSAQPEAPSTPAPSGREKWFGDLGLFIQQLAKIQLGHMADARAELADAEPGEEPMTEAEIDAVLADLPRLDTWCEERRECLRLSAQVYKEVIARYISARIERDGLLVKLGEDKAVKPPVLEGEQRAMESFLVALALYHLGFFKILEEWPMDCGEGKENPVAKEIRNELTSTLAMLNESEELR